MATLYELFNKTNNKSEDFVNNNKRIEIIADMDVTVTDEMFLLNVELAGVNKNDIQIEIKDSILCIQGEKYKSTNNKNSLQFNNYDSNGKPMIEEFEDDLNVNEKNKNTNQKLNNNDKSSKTATTTTTTTTTTNDKKLISERSFGQFKKYLDLTPVFYQLDLNTINAKLEDGLLTITVKKYNLSNNIKIQIN
ncbi:hypothetical protein ACTA71_006937 [Dictyostelium dimigraforme]